MLFNSSLDQTATIIQKQVWRGFIVKLNLQNIENAITGSQIIWFQYNPEKLVESFSIPDKSYYDARNRAYYKERKIDLSLTIDGIDDSVSVIKPSRDILGGITPELNKYRELLYPQGVIMSLFGKPPALSSKCILGFGARIMECRVQSLDITETQFNDKLVPIRAEISISLVEDTSTESGKIFHKIYRTFSSIGLPGG